MFDKFVPDKTLGAFDKIISDFKRVQKIFNICIPLIMMAYYIYALVTNLDISHLLILNSIMLGLLVINYIIDRIFDGIVSKKKLKKVISRTFAYLKHIVKIVATGFAIYEMMVFDVTAMQTVLTFITVVVVIIQIVVDIVTVIWEYYIELISESIAWDFREMQESKLYKSVVSTVSVVKDAVETKGASLLNAVGTKSVNILNKGLSKITKTESNEVAIQEPQPKENNYKHKKVIEKYSEKWRENREQKKEERVVVKQQSRQDKLAKEKEELKENLARIGKNIKNLVKPSKDENNDKKDVG